MNTASWTGPGGGGGGGMGVGLVGVDPEPPHPAIPLIRRRSSMAVDRIFMGSSFAHRAAAILLTLTEICVGEMLLEPARLARQEILVGACAVYEWQLTSN